MKTVKKSLIAFGVGLAWSSPALAQDVLWYYGNGGTNLTFSSDIETVLDDADADGFRKTTSWPSDIDDYKLVFLSVLTSDLSDSRVDDLKDFLATGGVLVVIGEEGGYNFQHVDVANDLLEKLDSGMRHDGESYGLGSTTCVRTGSPTSADHPAIEDVSSSSITYSRPGGIEYDEDDTRNIVDLMNNADGVPMMAAERNIILVTDINLFTDDCGWSTSTSGNAQIIENLYDGFCTETDLDADADGFVSIVCGGSDCEDASADINPDADEVCDGRDNDCDGDLDVDPTAGSTTDFYRDADSDGYGDDGDIKADCEAPEGYVEEGGDCDDTDGDTFPGAAFFESATECMRDADGDNYGDLTPPGGVTPGTDCNDNDSATNPGRSEICDYEDNNCNDEVDEGVLIDFFIDSDSDGFGDPNASVQDCFAPSGYSINAADCDDSSDTTFPGAAFTESTTECRKDTDGDGYGDVASVSPVVAGTDCDDADNLAFPGAARNDSVSDCMADHDGDDYGDLNVASPVVAGTDCDDESNVTFPGAAEGDSLNDCMRDADGDDYGDSDVASPIVAGTDCNDGAADINISIDEICDEIDNNCNAVVDDDPIDGVISFPDVDQDGFGATNARLNACSIPLGYIQEGTDCDDTSALNYPDADEYCDDQDNNCNGYIDESDRVLDARVWYLDADGDGYGDGRPLYTVEECDQPTNYVARPGDCDDSKSYVNPDAPEYCNGNDENCDGVIDENPLDASDWYADVDGDGYGDLDSPHPGNACEKPQGYVNDNSDCNDSDASVWTSVAGLASSCEADVTTEPTDPDGCSSVPVTATAAWLFAALLGFSRRRRR
ncbi:MAG: DUF4350 domain-containing protein [Myxococcota bacterium]